MKNIQLLIISLLTILLIGVVFFFESTNHTTQSKVKNKIVNSNILLSNPDLFVDFNQAPQLTSAEISVLIARKEAIKMSIDLNLNFRRIWKNKIFDELVNTYSDHNNKTLMFMTTNNIVNSQGGLKIGKFKNKSTQLLYQYLLHIGESSFENAVMVDYYLEVKAVKTLNYQLGEIAKNQSLTTHYEGQLQTSQVCLDKINEIIKSNESSYSLKSFLAKIKKREYYHHKAYDTSNDMVTNSLIHYHNTLYQSSHFSNY